MFYYFFIIFYPELFEHMTIFPESKYNYFFSKSNHIISLSFIGYSNAIYSKCTFVNSFFKDSTVSQVGSEVEAFTRKKEFYFEYYKKEKPILD